MISIFSDVVRGGAYALTPFTVFWFITALLFARMYMILAQKIAGLLGRVVLCLIGLTSAVVAADMLKKIWWSMGIALPCTFFIMIGIWGGQCSRSNRIPRLWKITIAVTLIALGIAGFSLGLLPLDIKSADFGTPILSILCAGMLCVGATMLGQQLLNGKRISFATWLSTRGLPVIFIHPLILMLTKQMGNATVVGFLFATVVSFIIAILIHISPKLARLLG